MESRGKIRSSIPSLVMFVEGLRWQQTNSICWKKRVDGRIHFLYSNADTSMLRSPLSKLSLINLCYADTATGGLALMLLTIGQVCQTLQALYIWLSKP